ncbi:hypothetical protein CCR94_04625 [Rhodoblastus sphagnicola]|uniref:Uncharacterized protein n=1 Tax=Rhodoblastus sphagnicola TaxID=333368 RepID=A0A2S6NDN1_9HYPH|nr:discoidin domain-containing protein [Rhodoblastus sphagnicola]MBB4200093.1 hypothetical protein [Rhodoblastus sphagnicola]PPQ32703.1 hypothetical protein CCR94_04625 [Rhodoblastus sphagnicola]
MNEPNPIAPLADKRAGARLPALQSGVPPKQQWRISASSGDPNRAADRSYSVAWKAEGGERAWLEIDLGEIAIIAGLEIYWGDQAMRTYRVVASNATKWFALCGTRHGEGGLDMFAFPPVAARLVCIISDDPPPEHGPEIVEINLYAPQEAASTLEPGQGHALSGSPIRLKTGASLTVDLGYPRLPIGALIEWGEDFGTVFSVHLSDDGEVFREVGRIETGDGGVDSFWWRSTTGRYFRLTLHEANTPAGAVIQELKLRLQNKDHMPIGALERAAISGVEELYPQTLLGRQVYWTALGEWDQGEQALIDEYGAIEPRRGAPQIAPLLRCAGVLRGAPGAARLTQTLDDGALPIASVVWETHGLECRTTAFAHEGQLRCEHRICNHEATPQSGGLTLVLRPLQINPYWQHGGHAATTSIALKGQDLWVNGTLYAAFSRAPDFCAIADFDKADIVKLIERQPLQTAPALSGASGLLSAAFEFSFALAPGESFSVKVAAPMRDGVTPSACIGFEDARYRVRQSWRDKIGPRLFEVGDREVGDTLEAQIVHILVNSTPIAFKPGPRNYDRTWIRDGSAQALALLWAGLIEDAKTYVLWYAQRIYPNGLVPPILDVDGQVNHGYGGDIEFDAQGEFVLVAADVYRITRDRAFLEAVFEPVLRATNFLKDLTARREGDPSLSLGLVAPSISHEGYSKPSFSYWDDYFALAAWRNCAYLAREIGADDKATEAEAQAGAFAQCLTRSIRATAAAMGVNEIPGSADREDVDPTATSIAFEPCRVEDVLPPELVSPTFARAARRAAAISAPDFSGNYSPYELRNVNVFVALGRFDDAFRLLNTMLGARRPPGWRGWAEVVWGDLRAPDYIGDMPHTWIAAEFFTAIRRMLVREEGGTLALFRAVPDAWWDNDGIAINGAPTAFGLLNLRARKTTSGAKVKMKLSGPAPERVTFRYPGAKRAWADGHPCEILDDTMTTPAWRDLVIEE